MLQESEDGDLIEKSIDPITISTIERLCAEQAYSKALSRLGSTGIHSPNEETFSKLQNLHPQNFTPWNPPTIDEQKGISDFWDTFWDNTPKIEEKILAAISSFAPGSAGGPGGLKPSQLQDILKSCTPHTKSFLIKGFSLFIQNWTKGRFPPHIAHYFMSASLTPLKKPDGGVRPIAVGMTLRRIVSKFLMKLPQTSTAAEALAPIQCGFAGKNICEKLSMGLQSTINNLSQEADWVLLCIDVKNAFNCIYRDKIIAGVLQHTPHLYPWVNYCIQKDIKLFCNNFPTPILSSQGVQQGDPLGPLLFSLGLQSTIESIPNIHFKGFYLDDGAFI